MHKIDHQNKKKYSKNNNNTTKINNKLQKQHYRPICIFVIELTYIYTEQTNSQTIQNYFTYAKKNKKINIYKL